MGERYSRQIYVNTNIRTATTAVATTNLIAGPIDVSEYERLCYGFQNDHTAVTIVAIRFQAALDSPENVSNGSGAPNWFDVPTTTIACPSSIGPSAITITGPMDNCYRYIRITGGVSTTAAGSFRLLIGGFRSKG